MAWSSKSPDFRFLAKSQSLETLDSLFTKKLITYFSVTAKVFWLVLNLKKLGVLGGSIRYHFKK